MPTTAAMTAMTRSLVVFSIALLASACAEMFATGPATVAELKQRAQFDLDCPKAEIRTVTIDDRTKGVVGCGKRATYVQSCDHVGQFRAETNCTWIMNSEAKRSHDE